VIAAGFQNIEFAPIGTDATAFPIPASLAPIGIINPLKPTCASFFIAPKEGKHIVKIKTDKSTIFNNFFIIKLLFYLKFV